MQRLAFQLEVRVGEQPDNQVYIACRRATTARATLAGQPHARTCPDPSRDAGFDAPLSNLERTRRSASGFFQGKGDFGLNILAFARGASARARPACSPGLAEDAGEEIGEWALIPEKIL
jgi:hypothetical protein